jgi:hypothetical protein
MEDGVRVFPDSKGTLPGVPNVIYKPIPAAFTNNHRGLFVDVFLQLLGIQMLRLIKQIPQLPIDVSCRLRKDPVET